MKFKIKITANAKLDIKRAADCIEFNLKNRVAADNLVEKAYDTFYSLSELPYRIAIVDDPFCASRGVRAISVNNYPAFFNIDEQNNMVTILRFLYAKTNWVPIVRSDF